MSLDFVALSKFVGIQKGKKHTPIKTRIVTSKRYLQIDDLRNDNNLKYTDDDFGVEVDKNDVVIAWDGANAGTVGFNKEGLIGSTLARLSFDIKKVDPEYLGRFLQSKFVQLRANCTGATIPHISKVFLISLQIPLPPLETQKQIAAILEKADQLRKDCQQMEQELNSLAQSVFIEMFGDPVSNPMGWELLPIKDILNTPLQNGAYYPKEDYSSDGVEMVHMKDVFYDFVARGNLKRVNATQKDVEKYGLTSKDILISRRSLMIEGAAKPSLIEKSKEKLIFESSMIRLTPNPKIINTLYLFYYLSDSGVKKKYISQYITGATIKGINQANLVKVLILVPDIKIQNQFYFLETIIRKQKLELKKLIKKHENLFNALMQKAFKGELNLK